MGRVARAVGWRPPSHDRGGQPRRGERGRRHGALRRLAGCAALGQADGLSAVNCGYKPNQAVHGFIPAASKTDNSKVRNFVPQEIDTRFKDGSGQYIDGLKVTWIDPLGASNEKWSYWAPDLLVFHEAHVENVEVGTHKIKIQDQPGCQVGAATVGGSPAGKGPARST